MQGGNQEHDTPAYRLQPQLSVQLESQTTGTQSLDHMEYQTYPAAPTQPPLYPHMVSHSQPSTIVIHTTTLNRIPVGRDPTFIRCPSCQSDVVTVIHNTTSKRTHAAALILCFVGLFFCMCIPYCLDTCKTANHYCPACNSFVGSRKK